MAIGILTLTNGCGIHPAGNSLSWTHTGVTTNVVFQVQFRPVGAGTWEDLVILPVTTLSYDHDDSQKICGNNLEYQVVELISGVVTTTSNSVNCLNNCDLLPDALATVTITCPATFSATRISWPTTYPTIAHTAYVSVNIYRDTTVAFLSPVLIGTVANGTGFFDDTNIIGNTTYFYRAAYVFTGAYAGNEGTPSTIVSCVTANSGCGNASPLSTFDYSLYVTEDCNSIQVPGLISTAGAFIVPAAHACDDITLITNIVAQYSNNVTTVGDSTEYTLGLTSTLYDATSQSFLLPVSSDGVYSVKLTVTYTDQLGQSKTVTSTRCILVSCNCIKCDIATRIIEEHDKADDMLLMYQSLLMMSECQQCYNATLAYNNLINLIDDGCNC